MKITNSHTDDTVLAELGERISKTRVSLQLTQAALAEEAGVSKRTVERIEGGSSVHFANLLRVLRVLDLLEGLNTLVPEPQPRPMDLLKLKGKERQRASSANIVSEPKPWTWGEDS